ncbi:MAG: WD40/YVTN/BNR-like repeat-containing protein [Planctomycetota bacterium]
MIPQYRKLVAQEFWELVPTHSEASFRGLAPIDRSTAFVCGSQATLMRTVDAGKTWTRCLIEGLESKTELRSIHAWSADELIVATAGVPCRIYYSKDAGKTWTIVYENTHPDAFLDALRFWDDQKGFAFGDPIDGKLLALASDDRGQTWRESAKEGFPLQEGEAGFAASNSSLMVFGPESSWIGLGGAEGFASVLMSNDRGANWNRSSVKTIPSNKSSGIFSLARSPLGQVVAVGGDYQQALGDQGNVAVFDTESKLWRESKGQKPHGFRSSVVYLNKNIRVERTSPRGPQQVVVRWICAGLSGCDASADGEDWFGLSDQAFHAMAVASDGSIWACGSQGKVGLHTP